MLPYFIILGCLSLLFFYETYHVGAISLAILGAATLMLLFSKKQVAHQHSKDILNELSEGVVVLDWQGRILELNRKACLFLKGDKKTLIQTEFFSALNFPKGQLSFKRAKETKIPQKIDFQGIEIYIKILSNQKRVLITLLDSSFEYQKQELGKDFVANASHELRTPITIIKGFAETIYDLPEISEAMLIEFTEKIVRNCKRMDNLVKNLLTLADLDYLPKARMQEVDLVGLLDNCNNSLLALHPEIEIEAFQNEEIILVNGDPDLLELAVMNHLENAVKYSKSPAKLTITIADFESYVELSIEDQGIGIPSDDLEKVFERFYTVDKAHSRRLGGAGLGLSIVNVIVKKHDAKISAQSKVGVGTTFKITFQRAMALVR